MARPDIRSRPTAPTIASTFANICKAGGNTIAIGDIDAKILLGRSIRINPIRNKYHKTTSQKKSKYCLFLIHRYPLIPNPTNRWIIPNNIQNISRVIGSSKGTNHSAGTTISFPKNTLATTVTASPKIPPNISPQNTVESPQYINIRIAFCIPSSILGNFFIITAQAINTKTPYAASESISPKNTI